jgi:hypothetical protein
MKAGNKKKTAISRYMSEIGRRGGVAMKEKHGSEYFSKIAKKRWEKNKKK